MNDETDWALCMDNYFRGSEAHSVRKNLRAEIKPVSEKETAKQFPGKSLRIAAQGILNKPDGGHRIIHDGKAQ